MAKREKILLGILAAAVVGYLIYIMVVDDKGAVQVAGPSDAELQEIQTRVQTTANEVKFTDLELYKLEQAESEWTNNPFFDRVRDARMEQQQIAVEEEVASGTHLNLSYTGFVDIEGIRYAIINGLEYELLEEIEDLPEDLQASQQGLFVTNIGEDEVILGEMNATNEIVDKFFLPIEEDPLTIY